ncbi:unnamed protein product, partial [Pylaiella littoralis]
ESCHLPRSAWSQQGSTGSLRVSWRLCSLTTSSGIELLLLRFSKPIPAKTSQKNSFRTRSSRNIAT